MSLKTVCFYGTVPARSRVTLVSKRIQVPYWLRRIRATFPLGCINLVELSFHGSLDASAPTAGRPSDPSFLAENGQVDYLVGNGEIKDVDQGTEVAEGGSYLKVHAYNQDFADHGVDVQMTIEPLGKEL